MRMSRLLCRILVPLLLLLVICSEDNVHAQCTDVERQALLNIKQELEPMNKNDTALRSWGGEARDCCKWHGVACSKISGHVTMLDLSPEMFHRKYFQWTSQSAKIRFALVELRHLEYLDLRYILLNSSDILSSISTLNKLEYLNLSNCEMSGEVPPRIANLSRLEVLDLGNNIHLTAKSLDWVSGLSSLRKLDLSFADLGKTNSYWIQMVKKLPYLTSLHLGNCNLPKVVIPPTLHLINSSTSLVTLDLSGNDLAFPLHQWSLMNFSRFLIHLDISNSTLIGSIPESIGNSTTLVYLDLSGNKLEGAFSISFWNLCELGFLDVSGNNLGGEFPKYTKSDCRSYSLKHMDVSANRFTGSIPHELGKLSELGYLNLATNYIEGGISEAHFSRLSKLVFLNLSDNPVTLNISSNWTPPFQLYYIGLGSCRVNSEFPKWLLSQTNYESLDLLHSGISGPIPDRFWGTISSFCLKIDLSNNNFFGTINDLYFRKFFGLMIDLSSNKLEGAVPRFLFNGGVLNLSMNNFSNLNSLCDVTRGSNLAFLDISHNNLSGELPDCWSHVENLRALNLGDNHFSGKVPVSIGSLRRLKSLHLGNNNLTGELPVSLRNCSELSVFDVAENNLLGPIPTWLGKNVSNLLMLSLRSNHFSGDIPPNLCDLEKLQLLDLSQNKLSMNIPKCLGNLTAMEMNTVEEASITDRYILISFLDELRLVWKGKPSKYSRTLRLVKVLDLSSNNLIGTIPGEITGLVGLVSLNLSRNKLSGEIPLGIGKLKMLDALDLSNNHLSGFIPQSLSQVDRLSLLDISNNNLSGEIPKSTQLQSFPTSSFGRNPELCGPPLPKNCSDEEPTSSTRDDQTEDEDNFITRGFYVSIALGIVVGFWGVCGTLIFKRSWRYAYFKFFDNSQGAICVTVAAKKVKLLRMMKR